MASAPTFFATPIIGVGLLSAANTNMDGTGSIVTLLSTVLTDTKIELLRVHARQTTTAGMARFWLYSGSLYFLLEEIKILANTISASNPAFSDERDYSSQLKFIPAGWSLVGATHNAEAIFAEAFCSKM